MTVIIALKKDNKIYLGADSALVDNWTVTQTKQPKIFKLGEFLIGVAGYPRTAQLIQYQLMIKPQTEHQSDFSYLCTDFVNSVKSLLVDNDNVKNLDGSKQIDESDLLFGYRNNIYAMDTNFQIIQTTDSYNAIGSGQEIALGAMAVFTKFNGFWFPEVIIKNALSIVDKHHMGVCKPFRVMSI
jgi:ATP-dependent protease HslVU (ClpYQ) peptidase subunit